MQRNKDELFELSFRKMAPRATDELLPQAALPPTRR